jgi:signal transduction histidine kinase
MVVARVIHDGRRYLEPMSFAATSLLDGRSKLFDQTTEGQVIRKFYPVHAETINTGVKGLNSLFKALDPVSGKKRGKPGNFSALHYVNVAFDFMEDFLIQGSVERFVDVNPDLILYGYGGDLQSALLNIMDNAIHWLQTIVSQKRFISVSAESIDGFAQISISNNGPEIDPHSASKLFDAGFTLKTEGHGLGLVIAREACRASKGDLYFDDTKDDTTFVIKFPLGNK